MLFPGEREWNSPLTERQRYDEHEDQKSGYDAPRRYPPPTDSRHPDPRRLEGLPPSGAVVHRNCPSPVGLEGTTPRFERERLSPLHQKDTEMSPVPQFESPNSEHSDDGPLNPDVAPSNPHSLPKSILKAPGWSAVLTSVRQHSNSPGQTPPHDGGHLPPRFDGNEHMGPPRPQPPGWYDESSRFDGPHHQGPGRFNGGPPNHNMTERFDGPDPQLPHGPVRGRDGMGRFNSHSRFDSPIGQQPPARFVGQGTGHLDSRLQHFEPQRRFENNMATGPGTGPIGFQQQRPLRFDSPSNQMGPMRFEAPSRFDSPGQAGPRYEAPNVPHQSGHPHFEGPPRQQGPPRFPSQHNLQSIRPMAPPIYDNSMAAQQNFPVGAQQFSEFPTAPLGFPSQPNLPGGNFNMQSAPPFSQPGPVPFYSPAPPVIGLQQPVSDMSTTDTLLTSVNVESVLSFSLFLSCFQVSMMGNINQTFQPQNSVPFRTQSKNQYLTHIHTHLINLTVVFGP